MKNRSLIAIAVDAALAGLLVAIMATALAQETAHEYLGASLFAAVMAHAILNRRRFRALLRGHRDMVRALRLMAIARLLACVIGQASILRTAYQATCSYCSGGVSGQRETPPGTLARRYWCRDLRAPSRFLSLPRRPSVSFALIQEHPLKSRAAYRALDRLSQSPLVRQATCSMRISPISSQ